MPSISSRKSFRFWSGRITVPMPERAAADGQGFVAQRDFAGHGDGQA